jgi:hypothetical protein
MISQVKKFGDGPSITVYTKEKDWLDKKPEVEVNWSCVGSISVEDATDFHRLFGEALKYAASEQERIGILTPPEILGDNEE